MLTNNINVLIFCIAFFELLLTVKAKQRAAPYQGCFDEGKNRFVNPKMILSKKNPHVV